MSLNQIVDYIILSESNDISNRNANKLIDKVRGYIDLGWQPLGGVAICYKDSQLTYSQAIVLYDDTDMSDD